MGRSFLTDEQAFGMFFDAFLSLETILVVVGGTCFSKKSLWDVLFCKKELVGGWDGGDGWVDEGMNVSVDG